MVDCFNFLSWAFSKTQPELTPSRYDDDMHTRLLDVEITGNSSSHNDDLFSKLPKNIITLYILQKLPAKDLFQLMQVSKLFKSLISQPDFLNVHVSSLHPTQNYLAFHKYLPCKRFYVCYQSDSNYRFSSYKRVEIPFEAECFNGCVKVVGSTRGVVFFWYRDYVSNSTEQLFLWNPLIGKLERLPSAPPSWTPIQLVFGFGFDQVTVDFKVVKIIYQDWVRIDRAEAFVYAHKTKVWRSIGNVVPCVADLSNYDCCNSVSVNGAVYWLAYKQPLGYYSYTVRRPDCIMGFDVVEEAFKVVKLPDCILKHAKELRLSTWLDGESLAVFVREDIQGSCSTWSMFVMNVVSDTKATTLSWEKKITLAMSRYFVPQRSLNSRQVMVTVMSVNRTKRLVLIDVEDEEMRDIGDRRLPPFTYVTDYTPSLALIGS